MIDVSKRLKFAKNGTLKGITAQNIKKTRKKI